MNPAEWLLDRASSYARDAEWLRQDGHLDGAVLFETLAGELRQCAAEVQA